MEKQINMKISPKDWRKFEELKKLYEIANNSELIRLLINDEHARVTKYKEVIEKE